jgi:hypothetical protein
MGAPPSCAISVFELPDTGDRRPVIKYDAEPQFLVGFRQNPNVGPGSGIAPSQSRD